jgi:hypothetical protein
MDTILFDILVEISSFLNKNKDIVNLFSTTREYHEYKSRVPFLPFLSTSKRAKIVYHIISYKHCIPYKKYVVQDTLPFHIPKGTTHVKFNPFFEHVLKPGDIPNTVVSIKLNTIFVKKIRVGVIPHGVQYLWLGTCSTLSEKCIPDSVRHLMLGYREELKLNVIPNSVEILELTSNFGRPLNPGVIPNSVIQLTLHNYNHLLSKEIIPSSVKTIVTNAKHIDPELTWQASIVTY